MSEKFDWSALGTAAGAVAGTLAAAWTWIRHQRRHDSRDAVELAKDRLEVDIMAVMREERDKLDGELDTERKTRAFAERRALMAEAQLMLARHDITRLKLRLRQAQVPEVEIALLVESDFGTLDGPILRRKSDYG